MYTMCSIDPIYLECWLHMVQCAAQNSMTWYMFRILQSVFDLTEVHLHYCICVCVGVCVSECVRVSCHAISLKGSLISTWMCRLNVSREKRCQAQTSSSSITIFMTAVQLKKHSIESNIDDIKAQGLL